MARNYAASEVRNLQRTYQDLYARFRQLDSLAERIVGEIHSACAKIAGDDSMAILETISVDELNREKKGVRVTDKYGDKNNKGRTE